MTTSATTAYDSYSPFAGYQFDNRAGGGTNGSSSSGVATTYLTLNDTPVAEITSQIDGNGTVTGVTLSYVHANYLGTPVLQTNQQGDITNIFLTDAWGNNALRDTRPDAPWSSSGYTNHRFDPFLPHGHLQGFDASNLRDSIVNNHILFYDN